MLRRSVALVDNYDSFTLNIAHMLAALGASVEVFNLTPVLPKSSALDAYAGVVLGPGPGSPRTNHALTQVTSRVVESAVPLLGICLGMQAIAQYFGASIVRAPEPVHGQIATIRHDGRGLFDTISRPLRAMRYHSLCIAPEMFPTVLRTNATSEDGVIQSIEHRSRPVFGLQFHPESFCSEYGEVLLGNFLARL